MDKRIQMTTPLVEMDGDEMTRIIWQMIKDELLTPFVDLKTEYYDLGLQKRDETGDRITVEAGEAIKRLGVGVKQAQYLMGHKDVRTTLNIYTHLENSDLRDATEKLTVLCL